MNKKEIKFNIPGYEDRKIMSGIFAENGFNVRVEIENKKNQGYGNDYFLIVGLKNEQENNRNI